MRTMQANIQNFLREEKDSFNIIEEFSALSPKRKMVLCDHLFSVSERTFAKTVRILWPQATSYDIQKLEKFLFILHKTVH